MFISKAQELRRENAALHAQMCALVKKGEDEKRALTAEESAEWDRMDAEFETRKKDIEKQEKLDVRDKELGTLDIRRAGRDGDGGDAPNPEKDAERRALRAFISQAPSEWDGETRELIAKNQKDVPKEARAMGHGFVLQGRRDIERRALGLTGAAGGFTIAEEFMRELDVAMKDFSGILQAARLINTDTGADMPWPTVNDVANAGAILAEGSAAPETPDPTFAAVTFQAFLYTSKIIRVANQLLTDSAFNLESELAKLLGTRLGRILNTHGTTGTGTAQPRGVVTAVLAETTPVLAAASAAIAYGDLVELQHAVDPAYRSRPTAAFMMHDSIVKLIKKLLDSDGRPLWASGIAVREPDTILGHRFFINQDMDAAPPALGEESVLFGDFSKYIIRRVINPVLVRLNERYAEFYQTAFVMFDRWDSDLVDAGGDPIKVLQHP